MLDTESLCSGLQASKGYEYGMDYTVGNVEVFAFASITGMHSNGVRGQLPV